MECINQLFFFFSAQVNFLFFLISTKFIFSMLNQYRSIFVYGKFTSTPINARSQSWSFAYFQIQYETRYFAKKNAHLTRHKCSTSLASWCGETFWVQNYFLILTYSPKTNDVLQTLVISLCILFYHMTVQVLLSIIRSFCLKTFYCHKWAPAGSDKYLCQGVTYS